MSAAPPSPESARYATCTECFRMNAFRSNAKSLQLANLNRHELLWSTQVVVRIRWQVALSRKLFNVYAPNCVRPNGHRFFI